MITLRNRMWAIGALCGTLAMATPTVAATAKARSGPGWLTRLLARTAATRDARGQFKQLVASNPALQVQYTGQKRGVGVVTGMGLGYGGIGLWTIAASQMASSPDPVGEAAMGVLEATAGGFIAWGSNRMRDMARGNTVRFALANGFRVPAALVRTMKQGGARFGEFSAKDIAQYKLNPGSNRRR
jgi:hypothetical protein